MGAFTIIMMGSVQKVLGHLSSQRLVAKTNLPCSSPSYGKKTPFNFKKLTFKHQQCDIDSLLQHDHKFAKGGKFRTLLIPK